MTHRNGIPPTVICDHANGGDLYHVRPDGFRVVPSEDQLADFSTYMDGPNEPDAQPRGPVVTLIDFEPCERCNGRGEHQRGWIFGRDPDGESVDASARMVDCADCAGLGWHYDWGHNVGLEVVVARVKGEVAA